MRHGLVIKNTGSWYQVKTDDGALVECKIKGSFRLKGIRSTNPVAVGDRVSIEENREGTAFIVSIDERENYIIRKASNLSKESHILAANIDQTLLVVTVNHPQTSLVFIDRFLATAEAYRIPVKLIFNKIDLYDEDDTGLLHGIIDLYTYIGYECLAVSAVTGKGIGTLRELLIRCSSNAFNTAHPGSWRWVQFPKRQSWENLKISGKKCATSSGAKSIVPNPLTPGVSIIYPPPGKGNISENVVVCMPL